MKSAVILDFLSDGRCRHKKERCECAAMETMSAMERFKEIVRGYWLLFVLGVLVIVMAGLYIGKSGTLSTMRSDNQAIQSLIDESSRTYRLISKDFDESAHRALITERGISAKVIGEDMIAVDDALTAFYKSNEDLPTGDERIALMAELDKMKAANTRLTDADEDDHINTWQLNPEWTLKLASVVTYQDTNKVPVLFTMTTKDGKDAGMIMAVYDVVRNKLVNIQRHYTLDGVKDEIDVGGR